jgi:hypothetical protein
MSYLDCKIIVVSHVHAVYLDQIFSEKNYSTKVVFFEAAYDRNLNIKIIRTLHSFLGLRHYLGFPYIFSWINIHLSLCHLKYLLNTVAMTN